MRPLCNQIYLEYTFSVERVEPLTLLHFRTTANLHMNLGPLHTICLCSHSLLLRLRKFPLEYLIVIGRECLHQRKAKRNSTDLKWWQLHGVRLMACSLLSLSVLLHHGCCDRCSLAVAEL